MPKDKKAGNPANKHDTNLNRAKTVFDIISKGVGAAVGLFKIVTGLFNKPEWYQFHGRKVELPINSERPMDPRNMENINGTGKFNPGVGVTHVIYNNVEFNPEIFDSEAFKLATSEAFNTVRQELRSNLPYTIEEFQNFIATTFTLCAASKFVERTLGWYTAVRKDIPELHFALTHIPGSDTASGIILPVEINMLADENYSETLNKFMILKDYCNQIVIPKKLAEYISWWVSAVFADQSAANPQMYLTLLRDMTLLGYDSEGQLTTSTFDPLTSDIDELISQAQSIIQTCGVMNADLSKSEVYGRIQLVHPDNYNKVALEDAEFFNVLINSYNVNKDSEIMKSLMDNEYIRGDILDKLPNDKAVGSIFGFGKWAGIPVPFSVVSQACYLTATEGDKVAKALQTTEVSQYDTDVIIEAFEAITSDGFYIQITGSDSSVVDWGVSTPSPSIEMSFDSITAITSVPTSWSYYTLRCTAAKPNIPLTINGTYAYTKLGVYTEGENTKHLYLMVHPNQNEYRIVARNSDGVPSWNTGISCLTSAFYISGSGDTLYLNVDSGAELTILRSSGSNVMAESIMMGMKTVTMETDWTQLEPRGIIYSYWEFQRPEINVGVSIPNTDVQGLFCELVDYHMPIIRQKQCKLTIGVTGEDSPRQVVVKYATDLLKECYKPYIIAYDNIKVLIYQMVLGLFSMK